MTCAEGREFVASIVHDDEQCDREDKDNDELSGHPKGISHENIKVLQVQV